MLFISRSHMDKYKCERQFQRQQKWRSKGSISSKKPTFENILFYLLNLKENDHDKMIRPLFRYNM